MKLTQAIPQPVLLLVLGFLIAGCANQMEPAKQALDGVDAAISAAAPDASKYTPDEYQALRDDEAKLKASFDKKDYEAVLAGAPSVLAGANGVAQAAAAKKQAVVTALNTQWSDASSSVPKMLADLTTHVDALSKSKRVPKGVDLEAAKSALANAKASWDKAQASFSAGKVEDAVNAANDSKDSAESAATAIKLKPPGAD